MKVLLIHSHYRSRGGEDVVLQQECELLLKSGHVVECMLAENSDIGVLGILRFLYDPGVNRRIRVMLKEFRPDIVHVHNLHFGFSPSLIRQASRFGKPVVMTFHNFRLICMSGTLSFHGEPYLGGLQPGFPWRSVLKGVYRGSRILTFWFSFVYWVHGRAGTWGKLDRIFVVSPFAKSVFSAAGRGFDMNRFVVRDNFIPGVAAKKARPRSGFLFIGRLTSDKGVEDLLDEAKRAGFQLGIIGDGELKGEVEAAAATCRNITYHGHMDRGLIQEYLADVKALIFPSRTQEGQPMVILESLSAGTPVVYRRSDSLESVFGGLDFMIPYDPGTGIDLSARIKLINGLSQSDFSTLSGLALDCFNERFSEASAAQKLDAYYSFF